MRCACAGATTRVCVPPPYEEAQSLRSSPTRLSDSRVPVEGGMLQIKGCSTSRLTRCWAHPAPSLRLEEGGVLQIKWKPLGGASDQRVRQINPPPVGQARCRRGAPRAGPGLPGCWSSWTRVQRHAARVPEASRRPQIGGGIQIEGGSTTTSTLVDPNERVCHVIFHACTLPLR